MMCVQMFVTGLMSVADAQLPQAYEKAGAGLNNNENGQNNPQGTMPFPQTRFYHVNPNLFINTQLGLSRIRAR